PNCGAPLDVRTAVSRSGWVEQPPIRDMTRIQFGQSRVQVEGRQVPVADFALAAGDSVYFSHHTLLWTEHATQLGNSGLGGGWKRMMAGLPLIMMEAHGPGRLALSDNHAGELIALPLQHGQAMWVREHRFLAATGNVGYDYERTGVWYTTGSGDDRETHYPLGQYGDIFSARSGPGLLLLHAPGNVFLRDLQPGEPLLVQPGALVYRDVAVTAHLHLEYPRFQGVSWRSTYEHRMVWLRLVGPGRVAVQSVFGHQTGGRITSSSGASRQSW
ncbi:MAG TPA: AIM24 family protein, partial [Kineosporiaceae bacterium]|nr:AIM24 family protein [Kineosporiaceae bacterium]